MTKPRLSILALACLLLLGVAVQAAEAPRSDAKTAVCPVCKLQEGETEAEPVKATSKFKGETYGFCSKQCKTSFEQDPEAYLPPVLPRPAPAFTVKGLDNKKDVPFQSIATGKPVLLDFWATWCAPCIGAMPELEKLHRQHAAKGFSVVGISIDEDPRKARKFAEQKKLAYPVYLDTARNPAWAAYHVRVIPAMFLIDGEGRVVQQWVGTKTDFKEVEAAVAKLMG